MVGGKTQKIEHAAPSKNHVGNRSGLRWRSGHLDPVSWQVGYCQEISTSDDVGEGEQHLWEGPLRIKDLISKRGRPDTRG